MRDLFEKQRVKQELEDGWMWWLMEIYADDVVGWEAKKWIEIRFMFNED